MCKYVCLSSARDRGNGMRNVIGYWLLKEQRRITFQEHIGCRSIFTSNPMTLTLGQGDLPYSFSSIFFLFRFLAVFRSCTLYAWYILTTYCSYFDCPETKWKQIWNNLLTRVKQRRLAGYSPWGHKESDMTEQLSTAQHRAKWHSQQPQKQNLTVHLLAFGNFTQFFLVSVFLSVKLVQRYWQQSMALFLVHQVGVTVIWENITNHAALGTWLTAMKC